METITGTHNILQARRRKLKDPQSKSLPSASFCILKRGGTAPPFSPKLVYIPVFEKFKTPRGVGAGAGAGYFLSILNFPWLSIEYQLTALLSCSSYSLDHCVIVLRTIGHCPCFLVMSFLFTFRSVPALLLGQQFFLLPSFPSFLNGLQSVRSNKTPKRRVLFFDPYLLGYSPDFSCKYTHSSVVCPTLTY